MKLLQLGDYDYFKKDEFLQAFGYEETQQATLPQATEKQTHSALGQSYYATDALGREDFLPGTIDGYLLPMAVMSITEKKTIIATPLPESIGSVAEQISIDNYLINIKGILVTDDGSYPESDIQKMHNLFKKQESLTMRSVLSDIFLDGVHNHKVVIKEIRWPATPGKTNMKIFEMSLESDMCFDLEL